MRLNRIGQRACFVAVLALPGCGLNAEEPGPPINDNCDTNWYCNHQFHPHADNVMTEFGFQMLNQSVGARGPLKPLSESREKMGGPGGHGPLPPWTMTPVWDSKQGSTGEYTYGPDPYDCHGDHNMPGTPNEFDAQVVQGIYHDDMWIDRATEFAPHTIYMVGSATASVGNLEAGKDLTYPGSGDDHISFRTKYAIGAQNKGVHVSGGTFFDRLVAKGADNLGFLAFDSAPLDPGTPDPTEAKRWFGVAIGSENHAFISNRISISSEGTSATLMSGVDARSLATKEDDKWAPISAVAHDMRGAGAYSFLDTKRLYGSQLPSDFAAVAPVDNAGYVHQAYGLLTGVTGQVENSFINANLTAGIMINTCFTELLRNVDPECQDDRCDSAINNYYHLYGAPITDTQQSCPVEIGSVVGIYMPDLDVNSGGGEPFDNSIYELAEKHLDGAVPTPVAGERRASIITRGDIFIGDGQTPNNNDTKLTGYNTDVLHVRDVLHLAPRTEPPGLDPNLAPSDKIGLVYFDVARARLRISLPIAPTGAVDEESPIVWADIPIDLSSVQLERDVLGVKQNESLREEGAIAAAVEEAASRAAQRQSKFLHPAIQAIVLGKSLAETSGTLTLSFQIKGFRNLQPELFYRVIDVGGRVPQRGAAWKRIEPGAVTEQTGLPAGFRSLLTTLEIPLKTAATVEFIAIDPETGKSVGTAVHVGKD